MKGRLDRIARVEAARAQADITTHVPAELESLSIVPFVLRKDFLNQGWLYPRQATLLKLIFLELGQLTDYDRAVIAEWGTGFELTQDQNGGLRYEGDHGTRPDVLERAQLCLGEGRHYFGEVISAVGRRGSKGHLGAICGAKILWDFIALGDPNRALGIRAGKRLTVFVFAGQKDQALGNQWRDLADVIEYAPCFKPFFAGRSNDSVLLWTPAQFSNGHHPTRDEATIEIRALASTTLSGRGPAAPLQFYDEMAHMIPMGANRGAGEVFDSATPAAGQFGHQAFIYEPSSPWSKQGRFYENFQYSMRVVDLADDPNHHASLAIQLRSPDLYQDWELTQTGEALTEPGGSPLPPTPPPAITDASPIVVRTWATNPEIARTEFDSKWMTSLAAYLPEAHVDAAFGPWRGDVLVERHHGTAEHGYHGHGDPSLVGANFGWAIAHRETDEHGNIHAVFDVLHHWDPHDWPDGHIDYDHVTMQIVEWMRRFNFEVITFDQYNAGPLIQTLRRLSREAHLARVPLIEEQNANTGSVLRHAECLKAGLAMGRVHFPLYGQAIAELKSVERNERRIVAATRGECQTKDVFDAIANVTWRLLGEELGFGLSEFGPSLAPLSPTNPYGDQFSAFSRGQRAFGHGAQRGLGRYGRRR